MLHGIVCALLGLVAGLAARALLPGQPAGGWWTTAILGTAGGWLASFAGERLGLYRAHQKAGFLMSILGAMALMLIYSLVLR
jgi:uncharacterized membrane protein YeaQ/YmgE (transglycosylase-associated protein family)